MIKETLLLNVIDEISMGPFGSDIKVDNFIASGVPVLNGSNVSEIKLIEKSFKYISEKKANSLGKANARRGDMVITHRGTLGQVSYIPYNSKFDRYIISQSQFRIRFKNEINPIYLTYLFHTTYGQKKLLSFKNHVGVPALAQATSNFKLLELRLHDKLSQNKIAAVLSSIDDKIELNNKINTELEAMAKTLYDYWFVQFDFPDANGKPYKSSGGKMVYNDVLKTEVPEGWEVKPLFAYLDCNKNTIRKTDAWSAINYLDTSNLTENRINSIQAINPNSDVVPSRAQRIVKENDILISTVRPNLRHYGIIKSPIDNMIASTGFAILSYKSNTGYNDFFYMHITSDAIQKKLESMAASAVSSYPSINPSDILGLAITLPSDFSIVKKISNILSNIFLTVSTNQQQNQELSALRDWLLPMLMNGQLTVGAAYEQVEEVLSMAAEDEVGYDKKQDRK
ncbi:restriction endonuclease subunit S [soil metagenome]